MDIKIFTIFDENSKFSSSYSIEHANMSFNDLLEMSDERLKDNFFILKENSNE